KTFLCLFVMFCAAVFSAAQNKPLSASPTLMPAGQVSRTVKAMHYRPGASVKIDLHATDLMPGAVGEAKIEGKKSSISIDAKFQSVEDATKFGLEYLTYVLWAISPEGRADSLGEVVIEKGIAHIATGDKYATSILPKADQQLMQAETAYRQKQGKSAIESAARETTQTAEEARVMAVKQRAEDEAQAKAAADKLAAEQREAEARANADAESKRRADAEEAQKQAEAAKAEAEKLKAEAVQAAQEAARQREEAEKAKAEAVAQQQQLAAETAKAQQAAAQSDQLRQQAENEKQE